MNMKNMNLLQLLICLVATGFATSIKIQFPQTPRSKLHRLCDSDVQTLCQDVEIDEFVGSTPFEDLKRLTHGQESYPALKYGQSKDVCMWHAFFNNQIQSEECSASLKTRVSSIQKQLAPLRKDQDAVLVDISFLPMREARHYLIYHKNPIWLHILAFLSYSFACHVYLSKSGLSRCTRGVAYGICLVATFVISIASPLVTLGGSSVLFFLLILSSNEDEDEKQHYEDGYRRMADDDETVYVAVPLQVV